jgi:hypothetical protein
VTILQEYKENFKVLGKNVLASFDDTTNKNALIVSRDLLLAYEKLYEKTFTVLKERLLSVGMVFQTTMFNHFLSQVLYETIEKLIPSGIISHLIETHKQSYYQIAKEEEVNEPSVFSLGDLDFGFYIWLPCVGVSILVFFGELIHFRFFKKNIKKSSPKLVEVKFAKVFPLTEKDQEAKLEIKSVNTEEDCEAPAEKNVDFETKCFGEAIIIEEDVIISDVL